MPISYQAQIIKAMDALNITSPDKSNVGTMLAQAFLWDTVASYAKKKSEEAWAHLEKAEIYNVEDAGTAAGTTVLSKSPHFALQCTQSNPVKRFSVDHLAGFLKRKYRIPEPITKQACEEAKQPTKPNRSLKIVEIVS